MSKITECDEVLHKNANDKPGYYEEIQADSQHNVVCGNDHIYLFFAEQQHRIQAKQGIHTQYLLIFSIVD